MSDTITRINSKNGTRWGYALGWYGQYLTLDKDPLYAKLKFLVQHNFKSTHCSFSDIIKMSDAERDKLGQFLSDNDLELIPGVGINHMDANPDDVKRSQEATINNLYKYCSLLRNSITHSGANAGHRFDRVKTVDEKMESLSKAVAPIAAVCEELGRPMCIEDHGDFYCSDLVKLCKQTPHLYIFLDTGNTYLIGEQPIPAFEAAAPYTIGTHFKDHTVRPNPDILHFEVYCCALGDGDVPLRECYKILMEKAPHPEKLTMMFEMFTPKGGDPLECLDRSINFVNTL